MNKHPAMHFRSGGFTLVEVLLSSLILTVLLLLLLGMTEGASRIWRDSERRREPALEAREGVRLIGDDLRDAVLTGDRDSLRWGVTTDGGVAVDGLFLLVSHPRAERQPGDSGDLCITGYFTAPDPGGKGERHLYRFHASGNRVSTAFREHRLSEIYASARVGADNTELLARHVRKLTVSPLGESPSTDGGFPQSLHIALEAFDGATARRIAMTENHSVREDLIRRHALRISSIVNLPPPREAIPAR